ncbi:hypothetical protein [Spiroplasma endosymbiont of Virgichneumon dumeticola]|uniref:hypothetical protein n=1 Tax=Spiroplasma endosymbiont of Virgichneumon dumeticola TaxID=3139323 RepID=UPI0035C93EE3
MAVNIQKNLNNTEKLVEAPEFIEFFKQSNSPWASFFSIEMINSTKIEFIIKLPKDPKIKVLPWNDKSTRLAVSYAETDKIQKLIEKLYVAGETISAIDLLAENGQNLLDTMQYEVANDLADKLASDDTNIISQFATKVIIDKATEPKEQAIKYRTFPHMYLWRKQWNWMISIILFKLKNNVLHI